MIGGKPRSGGKFGPIEQHERGPAGVVTGTYYCSRCGELVDITRNEHTSCRGERR